LYKYDTINLENFHKYIDEKKNFVLLIKLVNNKLIACYSEGALEKNKNLDKDGLLISLSNREVFTLDPGCKAINYDENFLIFGNSELRLRVK
jgi:hypothetical protein